MSNILFIGKDLPENLDFAEALTTESIETRVFTSAKSETDATNFESERIFGTLWNKSSAVSTHAFLIKSETKLNSVSHVIFYFDSLSFCSKFELDKPEEVSAAVDAMINPFLYATTELLRRKEQLKEKTIVSFLVRTYPSKLETLTSKVAGQLPASSIVNIAETAFITMAENFAATTADHDYISVLLAKNSPGNELYKNEKQTAIWLIEGMNAVFTQKNKQTLKQAATWNKVGSKVQTGFSLFR